MAERMHMRETVCHLIHRADYLLNKECNTALAPYGVSMYQAMCLIYVADHEQERAINQRTLERYTQLSNPGVTKLVTVLEKLDLLERTHDPDDARSYILHATQKGREQAEIFRQLILECDHRETQALTQEERAQLTTLLAKLHYSAG